MILEEGKRQSRVHVVSLKNRQSASIGRGKDSAIRIDDKSVSRCHAFITLRRGKFRICDNQSKFGTLVRIRRRLLIRSRIEAQVAGVLMELGPEV